MISASHNKLLLSAKILTLVAFPACIFVGKIALEIAAVSIGVLFLVHSWRTKNWGWCNHHWVRAGLVFWIWQIVSALWAYDPFLAFKAGLIWGRFFLCAVAIAYWIFANDVRMLRCFFSVVIGYISFLSIDSLIQYFFRVDLLGNDIGASLRLYGPFNKPIVGAAILYVLFPVMAYALHATLTIRKRLFFLTLSGCCILAIALSGERATLLLCFFGLCLLVLFSLFHHGKRAFIPLGGIGIVLAGCFWLMVSFYPDQTLGIKERQIDSIIDTISHFPQSPYGRIWHDNWLIIQKHPLLGVGARNIRIYWCDMGNQVHYTEDCPLHPHNLYLEMTGNFGFIGLALFMATLFFIGREFWHSPSLWKPNPILLGIAITFILRIWPLVTVTSDSRSMSAFPFWLIAGWGLALIALDRQQEAGNANRRT